MKKDILFSPKDILKKLDTLKKETYKDKYSIFIIRNYTVENMIPYLEIYGLENKIELDIQLTDYDNYMQFILDNNSKLYKTHYDMILLTLAIDNIPFAYDVCGRYDIDSLLEHLKLITEKLKKFTSTILITTLFNPVGIFYNNSEEKLKLNKIEQFFLDLVKNNNKFFVLDIKNMVTRWGYKNSFDLKYWFLYHAPFKHNLMCTIAQYISELILAIKGNIKKLIVVDCDNTLWGGIVGELGYMEINLDKYQYPGNIYYFFQKQLLALKEKGVLLAICSKNNEKDVLDVLDKNENCLIKRKDIVSYQINWNNKATNINQIAYELNIGLDSIVFIDDSPVECELVRKKLPMVDVYRIPEKVYELPLLLQYINFLGDVYTDSDNFNTTQRYIEESKRKELLVNCDNLDNFLNQLGLKGRIGLADHNSLDRIVQLLNKTNQFNLTTHRYTYGEIEKIFFSDKYRIYTLNAEDKYGSYGLTGVCIVKFSDKNYIEISDYILSCRVLGREYEYFFLNYVLKYIKESFLDCEAIIAQYIATKKNNSVSDFYEKMHFECIYHDQNMKKYLLKIKDYTCNDVRHIELYDESSK